MSYGHTLNENETALPATARLDELEKKLRSVQNSRQKLMEWIATLSEQIESLEDFREEVRASFEPLARKLEHFDEVMRIMRHATCDIGHRVEILEQGDKPPSRRMSV
jgi:chromosome segregation ATPase